MGALGKARGLLGKGDCEGAAAALEGCEGLRERALLAQARAGQKDFAEALRLFEDVRDREGARKSVLTPEQWNAMGQAAERTGQPREALAAYERVLEGRIPKSLSPDLVHFRAGSCSKEVGDWVGAVEHFEKVKNPLFVSMSRGDIMCELDECYRNLGQNDRAEECMDSALEEHPVRPKNVLALAWHMYHRTKSANGPMLLLRKLLERDEGNAAAWHILGKIWLDDGDLDKAEDALEQSREIDPEKVALWETFSTLYSKRGESERALSALQRAAELDQASGGAAAPPRADVREFRASRRSHAHVRTDGPKRPQGPAAEKQDPVQVRCEAPDGLPGLEGAATGALPNRPHYLPPLRPLPGAAQTARRGKKEKGRGIAVRRLSPRRLR